MFKTIFKNSDFWKKISLKKTVEIFCRKKLFSFWLKIIWNICFGWLAPEVFQPLRVFLVKVHFPFQKISKKLLPYISENSKKSFWKIKKLLKLEKKNVMNPKNMQFFLNMLLSIWHVLGTCTEISHIWGLGRVCTMQVLQP